MSTSSIFKPDSSSNVHNVAYTTELDAALLLDRPEPGGISEVVLTLKVIFSRLKRGFNDNLS